MTSTTKGGFLLERELIVPRDIHEVFAFFCDPANLDHLTPPWLTFRIVGSSTPEIGNGTLIDYKLKVRGIPLRWRSRIVDWNPPFSFADEQLRGPYRSWFHRHTFEDLGGKTSVGDSVRYSVLGGALINRLLVRPDVERIFDYRLEQLAKIFGS